LATVGLRIAGGATFGPFPAAEARFGPPLGANGLEGVLVVAEPLEGCSPLVNRVPLKPGRFIALVQRSPVLPYKGAEGRCTFVEKVLHAEAAGAAAVVVYDSVPELPVTMGHAGGSWPEPTIPSVFIDMEDGEILRNVVLHAARLPPTVVIASVGSGFTPLGLLLAGSFGVLLTVLVMGAFFFHQPAERRTNGPSLPPPAAIPVPTQSSGLPSKYIRRLAVTKYCDLEGSDKSDECSICLEEYALGTAVKVLPCGHIFHPVCIDKWLAGHGVCPLCKCDVRESLEDAESTAATTPLLWDILVRSPNLNEYSAERGEDREDPEEEGELLIDIGLGNRGSSRSRPEAA